MSEQDYAALSDPELVAHAKAGEPEAFGELYQRHMPLLYRYLCSRVTIREEAEDLVDEVFLKAFQNLGRYEERGVPYSAYLYRIARHALIDGFRNREPVHPLEAAGQVQDAQSDIETQLQQRADIKKIRTHLACLPEPYQEVIRLRLLLDLSTVETAQWMGKRPGAVRVQLFRAVRRLRTLLEDDLNED